MKKLFKERNQDQEKILEQKDRLLEVKRKLLAQKRVSKARDIINDEIDTFPERGQDPYDVTPEQTEFIRKNIFPYWKGKSVEEAFLARTSEATKKIGVDTGFLDTDSKWRNGIGEISADYIDVLLPKGYGGIKAEALEYMEKLDETENDTYNYKPSKSILAFLNTL